MAVTFPGSAPQSAPQRQRTLRSFVRFGAGFSAAVAAMALVGWTLDNDVLKSVLPGHSPMRANTAVGLLLCAFALRTAGDARPWLCTLAAIASIGVLLLGCATLLQYGSGANFGIDTLLFADPHAIAEGRLPGRMSQISALAFVLLGWKGLDARLPGPVWLGQALALAIVAIGLFALSAYGYAMGTGDREAAFNPISLHTAVLLLLLGLGWLAATPDSGPIRVLTADSFGGELARRTLLPALLIPMALSYTAQMLRTNHLVSEGAAITLLALASGAAIATMIWWASALLDRVERQKQTTRELRDTANTDALTGLGNRRAFDAALAAQLALRAASGSTFALLLLDLDHFKSYNDTFGHPAGDEALRQAGLLLKLALRPGDVACRYGGEEFAVLLPGADAANALRVAGRIVIDVRSGLWTHRPVTISVGVAAVQPGDDASRLVARADSALYAAKAAGRDRAMAAEASD